ncbi:MAG: endonuclease domain-containing protein [Acidimicrobiia bacterium]|nr:endonuclease domain-containing protein [Acidimicrobiia bacterium]
MAGTMDIDAAIMEVAGAQAGVCTRVELLARGVRPAAIGRRVMAGLLRPTGRGIYVVEELTNLRTPLHHAIAAVPGGELSRSTAGRLQEFPLDPSADQSIVDVAAPHGFNRRVAGVAVHRRRRPTPAHDLVAIDGLPVTGPALTLVDLAAVVGPARLRHLVLTQISAGRPTLDELVACFDSVARRGVNGIASLRLMLAPLVDDDRALGSVLERKVAALLDEYGIAGFRAQYRPPWYDGVRGVVDFAHPESRIVLEADGRRWHGREQAMTNDRRRDRLAAKHGWLTIRVTWPEVTERPAATAAEILSIVTRRLRESDRAA